MNNNINEEYLNNLYQHYKHNRAILRNITIYQNFLWEKMLFYLILINIQFHSIVAPSMSHFDKSLVIIFEIELTENNACYFILDNFNRISISQIIEKKFFLI